MIDKPVHTVVKTVVCTVSALIAFAANSVLCRSALGANSIDAASFTAIRLLSGALVLFALVRGNKQYQKLCSRGSWFAVMTLFVYAISFSYAYITLETGTGALILFGAVQISMIIVSLVRGNRLHLTEWLGLSIAFAGFVYLVLPGVSAPSGKGFLLMAIAGCAWGVYTLTGRKSEHPLGDTACNFLRTLPVVLVVVILTATRSHYSSLGLGSAVLSGAVASGLGYTVWYMALRGLSTTLAAVVQLSVPVIAALGGVLFLSEVLTLRLVLASLLILGGILLVVLGRDYFVRT